MAKFPLYSLIALVVFVFSGTFLLIWGDTNNTETLLFLGTLLANVPGLVSAFMSERNNIAIHNGVITEKARQGATQALNETGVTQVASTSQQSTELAMKALSKLLESNTAATQVNTNTMQSQTKE